MKLNLLIGIILLVSTICKSTNPVTATQVKAKIKQKFPEIKQIFESTSFDSVFPNEKILFTVPFLKEENIAVTTKTDGNIHIQIKDVVPSFKKEIPRFSRLTVVRSLVVQLKDFDLEMDLNNKTLQLASEPITHYNPEVISNYREMKETFKTLIKDGEFDRLDLRPIWRIIIKVLIALLEALLEELK